jgi:hypothetical protein
MLTGSQSFTPSRENTPHGDGLPPEAITPWQMICLNEDKIPMGAIVVVPGKWITQ